MKVEKNKLILSEAEIQHQIMEYLALIPKVVPKFWRQNTGAMKIEDRFIKFGETGTSDILGYMNDGKILAIEVKRPGENPTPEQLKFLRGIHKANGIAIIARRIEDVNMRLKMAGYLK
ncbi:MAG TPA: VRR-NUC domain-containing protein [Candidatus Scalindua sp.]|nr:VRR-NUC domain-containing protein [Candidatus Scalindua sp.]